MSTDDKLIYMANQIAGFFAAQGAERGVAGVVDHLQRFWDPRMRRRLLELANERKSQLTPLVRNALPRLRVPLSDESSD